MFIGERREQQSAVAYATQADAAAAVLRDARLSTVAALATGRFFDLAAVETRVDVLYGELSETRPPALFADYHTHLLGEARHLRSSISAARNGRHNEAQQEINAANREQEARLQAAEAIISGAE
ncbi:MAG: hypothetical protein Q8K99_02290 [Actinomycetota bacterium]|nr:hypothetical protein [Actinomycetota bacterium]